MRKLSLRNRGIGVAAKRVYGRVVLKPLSWIEWQKDRVESAIGGALRRRAFADVQTYCMFIGYPRSGHSLVGSLIDAHPQAIISHELDALKYVTGGFSRSQLYYLILRNSRRFARAGRSWTGYSYVVPNQSQGRYTELRVIGDKLGGFSTRRLTANYSLLSSLIKLVNTEVRLLHITRNPFDNIATISRRQGMTLPEASTFYWNLVETVAKIKSDNPEIPMLDMRHEEIIATPTESLRAIFNFLGLRTTDDFLESCRSLLFEKPSKTSFNALWSPKLVEECERRIEQVPFLHDYGFAPAAQLSSGLGVKMDR